MMSRLRTTVLIMLVAAPGVSHGDSVVPSDRVVHSIPVRSAPSRSATEVARLNVGESAELLGTQPYWYRVRLDTGLTGFVSKAWSAQVADAQLNDGVLVVGVWNLEWLKDGKSRGFPENTYNPPGPTHPERTEDDYRRIAEVIKQEIAASILALSEIHGSDDGTSPELDRLASHLGSKWTYQIGSGGDQRLAFLWDTLRARNDGCLELVVPEQAVQGKDIFDRDPLCCEFTLLGVGGSPQNDVAFVALHLASGQHLSENHNAAMDTLRAGFSTIFSTVPFKDERDVLLGGDMNASRYDAHQEAFWDGFDPAGFQFRTLSPVDGSQYPGTRLAGVPLSPSKRVTNPVAAPARIVAAPRAGALVRRRCGRARRAAAATRAA